MTGAHDATDQDVLDAWRATAPPVFGLVDQIDRAAAAAIDPDVLLAVRSAVTSILGPDPGHPDTDPDTDPDGAGAAGPATPGGGVTAGVAFAEQFVVDVAGTTDDQRAAMTAAMGRHAFTFVQVTYVTDVFRRLRQGLVRLGPPAAETARSTAFVPAEGDLWALLERFMALVARLDSLDPLTTELIRLRGARAHDCRLCRSRRSVQALDVAGDPSVLEADDLDHPGLDERRRAALRLTDALVTLPASIDADLAAEVRARFTTDEVLELVLDVARNAANKIAVALGADAATVTDGVEFYDLDATGTVVADADMDAVRAATAR